MHHDDRGGRRKLDGKVAVADRIKRVCRNGVKAEQFSCAITVYREIGAGKGGRTEWHYIDTFAAVEQTLVITLQHFKPGHHVMTECDRLGYLHMRHAGHDRIRLAFGEADQCLHDPVQQHTNGVDLVAQVQPKVSGYLVIARTTGM